MSRVRFCCLVCVLVLMMLPALPPPAAAQAGPAEKVSGVFAGFWSWLTAVWAEAGCILDPSGRCASEAPDDQIDGGCYIDPSGACRG